MASKISIINFALVLIGTNPISSLEEESAQTLAVKLVYDMSLESILETWSWSFARRRKILNVPVDDMPVWGFRYAFNLPEDYLDIVKSDIKTYDSLPEYKIEGRFFLTDENPASILYTSRDINIRHVSAAFAEAFSNKLAINLCGKLSGSHTRISGLAALYADNLRTAMLNDKSESMYIDDPSSWADARL